jgi:signal transduction histidine kinase
VSLGLAETVRRGTDACRRVLDRFLLERDVGSVDPALGMHLRRLNAFTLIVGTLVLLIALKRFTQGAVVAGTIEASAAILMHVLRLAALRRRTMRAFRIAGGALIALGMWIVVGTALVLGQLESPSLLYLGLLPLAGGYYAGARGALGWGLAACASVAFVALTQLVAVIPPEVVQTHADAMATLLVVLLATTGFAYTAQRTNDRHLGELQEREEQIQRQATELAVARDTALETSRTKSTFLANTSHEIRTPMNVIIGMTDIALESDLAPEARDCLQRVRAAALGLLGIINDILDLSKIEAGKMTIEVGPFDLRAAVDELVTLMTPSAAAKGLALACRVDPVVPSRVHGDAGRIRQVLTNLLGNAIKFTEQGGVTLEVRAGERTAARAAISFAVRDTGIGIAPERQSAVFDSFVQADDRTSGRAGGTGLGLTISRDFIALMGGSLRLESTVGQGSTFSFTLGFDLSPAAPARLAAPAAA